jgi:hypothetical protein
MVIVKTSHNKIWHPEQLAVDIMAEYQQYGHVVIKLNGEGPCADAVGLYSLLDYLCDTMSVDKTAITIETVNFEETHSEYHIVKHPQHWIRQTLRAFNTPVHKRTDQALFGCLYNVPSWDRLCILAHAARLASPSTLHCNGTWEPHCYNSYYLDAVTDYCATEMFNIVDYLKTQPSAAIANTTTKPITAQDLMKVTSLYNNFFVDIVAETYTHGRCFFITEKTVRPMLMLTPFIVQAPQGYLSTLKSDYGIKTFDRWWDESYDQYQNYERIQKIYQVMNTLDQLSTAQRETMYKEMQPVLEHNRQIMQEFK